DFGFIEPVSLGSLVWLDSDADGVQDSAEPAIVGATVTLLNADGTVFDNDPVAAGVQSLTDVTDAAGLYNFNDLPEGDYRVQVDLNTTTSHTGGYLDMTPTQVADPDAAGPGQDNNTDSNVDNAAPGHNPAGNIYQSGVVTLSVGGEPSSETDTIAGGADQPNQTAAQPDNSGNMTVDFGFIQPVSLGSTIWQDLNGDGTQDAAEPGITGATITLLNPDGTVFDSDPNTAGIQSLTDTTDGDGQYNFDGLPPGDYRVQVDLSTVAGGSDLFVSPVQVADPDAAGPGQDNNTDSNVDLAFDANLTDQIHTSGVITLSSGLEPTAETDPIGAGGPDQPNQGLTATDDPDNSGNMTVDMAFVRPVSIGSTVWEDSNGDGIQDDAELLIVGATATLLNADGTVFDSDPYTAGVQALTDTTDAEGQYNFNSLPPGDYRVQMDVSTVTGGANFVPTLNQVADPDAAGPGQDNNTDTNIDIAFDPNPADSIHTSGIVTLVAGGEPTGETDPIDLIDGNGPVSDQPNQTAADPDNSGNMTVDFGFIATVSLGSLIWEDTNADGLQSQNEPPMAGAMVQLLMEDTNALSPTFGQFIAATDVANAPVPVVTTGLNGLYQFDNLRPGDYKVLVTPTSGHFPSLVQNPTDDNIENDSNLNLAATGADNSGGLPAGTFESNIVTLESGKEFVETDAERGDAQDGVNGSPVDESGNMTLDIGFIPPATIGNYVWLDLDMDGIQDANEDGIAGVQVILTPPAGIDVGAGPGNSIMTSTGPNGEYLFPDLPPYVDASPSNGYVVSVNPATLPPSLIQTFDEGPGGLVGVLDHTSDPIQLDPNEEHLTADFGYAPPLGSIGDTIWIDADDDGVQDPGEPGIPNVTVTLTPAPDVDLGSGLGVPISVVTDNNGKYLFPNLPLDAVYVVDVDISTLPTGYVSSVSGLGDPDVRDGNSTTADDQTTVLLTTSSPVNLDADFGYLPPADQNNSVGDTIWIDVDSDGEGPAGAVGGTDTNELPLIGVTVSLIDNSTGDVIATDITDTNGQYLFNGIPDGNYTVVVTDQNNVLDGLDPTYDDDGLGTPNQSTVDLDSGSTVFTPVADLDQDFGYVSPNNTGAVGSIGDTVFFDADNSNSLDPGEGLEGVVVSLYGPGPDGDITTTADNELLATDVTDENGNYLFLGLDVSDTGPNPGTDYQVVVDTTTLPNGGTGWTNSIDPNTPNPGDSMSVTTLTVAGPVDLDQDFGYIGTDNNTLSGTVWPDTDGDGTQAEIGVFSGVTIEVRDQNGNVIQKVVTDVNGNYSVTNLPDGIYVVVVTDEDNVLAPYEHTDSPNGASDTSDQTSKDDTGYTVDLDSTSISATPVTDTTGDFGYQPTITNPISLGSFKSELTDGAVTISWTTQTEVGNIGFNVYMKQGDQWQRLNEHVIPSQGDSTGVQRYSLIVPAGGQYFAIGDIDIYTQETLHGPFTLGEQHGLDVVRKATPNKNGAAGAAQEASRRTEKRMQQMQQRNQERKQRLGKPLGYNDGDSKQSPSEELTMNVKKSNTLWSLLIAGTLNIIIPNAYAADANAEDVLNLEVKSDGVYLVTHEALFDYGLDIAGEPVSRIALMNQGEPVPIAVTGSTDDASVFGMGSTIRFVGTGLDTLYTDTNVYTLRLDGDAAQRVDVDNRQPVGPVALSYLATRNYAPQSEYSFVSPDKSDPWYAERLLASGAAVDTQVQLNLDHYVPGGNRGSTKAKLSVNVWGASDSPGTQDHDVKVSFNGQEVVSETFNGLQERVLQGDLSNLSNGSNSVKVELPLASGQAFDLINLNAVTVNYPRAFIADGNELQFNSSQRRFVVQGFESDTIEVYRKDGSGTYQMGNTAVQGSCGEGAAGCAIMFAGTGSEADYYVVTQNALRSPGLRSLPVDDDINSGNAEYLIISHPDFMDTGLLEDLRDSLSNEFDGVDIVDVDNIYAEYGHHIFDPEAIRAYIKAVEANRGTNTVLLVGGDMYDYRQFQNQQARSFIPSIYASTDGVVNFAPVDAKYVDIDDDNVPDLSIGRLPVRNVAELSILLTKRTQFLGRNYTGKALFAADGYDHIQQYDFSRDADMVSNDYFTGWDTSKAYVDTAGVQTARTSVVDGINAGQTLTAFFGHSSTNQWSFSGLFNGDDAGSLNNQGKPTVVTQWGCWNTYYVSPNEDSMGHRFMVEGDRGAVSVMGASTLTSANAERELAQLVFARLTNGERLGDAILRAKQDYAQTNPDALDVLLGWTLLGMPELVLY
ncbi:MAG: SdrD B-like domain-containing protein, partial [Arenicella sp.]